MGTCLDPGISGFAEKLSAEYVDKTGLIGLINKTIGTGRKLTCISMPRRFGKSYPAQMLCAYYDKSCDSRELLAGYEIARHASFERHLNKYHVVSLDVTGFISEAKTRGVPLREVPARMSHAVRREAEELCSACVGGETAYDALMALVDATGAKVVAAAYMTGILPIKKDGSQSTILDFREYSMLDPRDFAKYVGFSEAGASRP